MAGFPKPLASRQRRAFPVILHEMRGVEGAPEATRTDQLASLSVQFLPLGLTYDPMLSGAARRKFAAAAGGPDSLPRPLDLQVPAGQRAGGLTAKASPRRSRPN